MKEGVIRWLTHLMSFILTRNETIVFFSFSFDISILKIAENSTREKHGWGKAAERHLK